MWRMYQTTEQTMMGLSYAGQLGGTTRFIIQPATSRQAPTEAMLAGTPAKNREPGRKINPQIAAVSKDQGGSGNVDEVAHTGKGHAMHTGKGMSYRDFVAREMRANGGNMKAAVAEWRTHKGHAGSGHAKAVAKQMGAGTGKRHRPLSRPMERRLAAHAEDHSAEHMQRMTADIQAGMTFKRAHTRAMASVGK
jgi:hypothetical protein